MANELARQQQDGANGLQIASERAYALQGAINKAQQAILEQATPPHAIKVREGKGGRKFRYVEQAWVTEQLNLAFKWGWQWEVIEWHLLPTPQEATECIVLGKLTVPTLDGDKLVKMQFGQSDIKRDRAGKVLSIGDDLKGASSDALKKCASLLGLALDLYSADIGRYEEPEEGMGTYEGFEELLGRVYDLYQSYTGKTDRLEAVDKANFWLLQQTRKGTIEELTDRELHEAIDALVEAIEKQARTEIDASGR